jgi:RimJ/RimL family protein N-acetyltransferase
MTFASPVLLEGRHVRLEPLSSAHCHDLEAAVADGNLHELWYTSVPAPNAMAEAIATRLAQQNEGSWLPFATVDAAKGRAAGMTNYLHIDAQNRRVEIGGTWLRKSLQRGPHNTEAKFLLLAHAFEELDCIAVELRTHHLNRQSRAAIERLGARLDGILRSHQLLPDGTLRDTCVYSITAAEWPAVKRHLSFQLSRR